MKIETIAQLMMIKQGVQVRRVGKHLMRTARTREERAAAAAYRRTAIGATVLTLVLVIGAIVITTWAVTTMEPVGRIGTVQSDGQIRYIQNIARFVSQEELNLQNWNLQPGDKVYIYTDSVTDEITGGMPKTIVEAQQNLRAGALVGYMVFMAAVLIFYALVICRLTSFGSAWYQYCLKQRQKEAESIPPRVQFVINVVAAILAVLLCWPQIMGVVENIRRSRAIRERAELIHSAGEHVQEYIDDLESMDVTVDLQGAEDAAGLIGNILDGLKGD